MKVFYMNDIRNQILDIALRDIYSLKDVNFQLSAEGKKKKHQQARKTNRNIKHVHIEERDGNFVPE